MIVEDDTPLRNALVRAFEREEFEARPAATFKIAYGFAPEFAVLDLSLRDGYGMELVAHLRAARPGVRIVVITGHDSIASSLVSLKAGAVDYLAKPVCAEQVVAAILRESGEAPEPPNRPMAQPRGRRDRHPRMGGLVQRCRLLEPIGNVPPAEAEASYHVELETRAVAV